MAQIITIPNLLPYMTEYHEVAAEPLQKKHSVFRVEDNFDAVAAEIRRAPEEVEFLVVDVSHNSFLTWKALDAQLQAICDAPVILIGNAHESQNMPSDKFFRLWNAVGIMDWGAQYDERAMAIYQAFYDLHAKDEVTFEKLNPVLAEINRMENPASHRHLMQRRIANRPEVPLFGKNPNDFGSAVEVALRLG